jgi:hypothetical protein
MTLPKVLTHDGHNPHQPLGAGIEGAVVPDGESEGISQSALPWRRVLLDIPTWPAMSGEVAQHARSSAPDALHPAVDSLPNHVGDSANALVPLVSYWAQRVSEISDATCTPAAIAARRGAALVAVPAIWEHHRAPTPGARLASQHRSGDAPHDAADGLVNRLVDQTPWRSGWGFEKAVAAAGTNPVACWFLDFGLRAWALTLDALRDAGCFDGDRVVGHLSHRFAALATAGPRAVQGLRDALVGATPAGASLAASLYRVPITLWLDGDPAHAVRLLDHLLGCLPVRHRERLGITPVLTYATAHAATGNLRRAHRVLVEGVAPGIAQDAEARRELAYHRLRYAAAMGEREAVAPALSDIVADDPSYAIRWRIDRAWRAPGDIGEGEDNDQRGAGDDARLAGGRTTASRASERGTGASVPIPPVPLPLEVSGDVDQVESAARVHAITTAARAFRDAMPLACRLRRGAHVTTLVTAGADADIAQLIALVDGGRWRAANVLAAILHAEVPGVVRLGLVEAIERLAVAIATAADVATGPAPRRRPSTLPVPRPLSRANVSQVAVTCARQCAALVDAVRALPTEMGRPLAEDAARIWDGLRIVEDTWWATWHQSVGRIHLEPVERTLRLAPGTWRTCAIRVSAPGGQPIPGAMLEYSVLSGPARPRCPTQWLADPCVMSMERGIAYLVLEASSAGAGVVRCAIRGFRHPETAGSEDSPTTLTMPYVVMPTAS